jgi:hypothetical protein
MAQQIAQEHSDVAEKTRQNIIISDPGGDATRITIPN